jgi:Protein of unknown function, DUF417
MAWIRVRHLAGLGLWILRYGLVGLLLLWGSFKFAVFEAEAIRPLVENSPLLSWLYPLFGVRGTSSLIGVVEVGAALLIPKCLQGLAVRIVRPGETVAIGTAGRDGAERTGPAVESINRAQTGAATDSERARSRLRHRPGIPSGSVEDAGERTAIVNLVGRRRSRCPSGRG